MPGATQIRPNSRLFHIGQSPHADLFGWGLKKKIHRVRFFPVTSSALFQRERADSDAILPPGRSVLCELRVLLLPVVLVSRSCAGSLGRGGSASVRPATNKPLDPQCSPEQKGESDAVRIVTVVKHGGLDMSVLPCLLLFEFQSFATSVSNVSVASCCRSQQISAAVMAGEERC